MRRTFLVVGLLSLGCASGMAPAPAPKVKPGKLAVSKPHQDGLVTQLRPVVTTLHADDPFNIALHWANEKGPIPAEKDKRPFARFATLRTMTFVLTSPDRKKHELKVDVPPPQGNDDWNAGLYYAPTYLFTVAKDGLAYQQHPQPARKFPWADKATVDLTQPGVWKVSIRGTITDGKVAGTAFESSEIELEVEIGRAHV